MGLGHEHVPGQQTRRLTKRLQQRVLVHGEQSGVLRLELRKHWARVRRHSSNIDAEGHLWNAQWGASRVVRYAPDGTISGQIGVPTAQPSCIAFGGRDLDLLFVTTAREGLSPATLAAEPHAGDLFVYRVNVKGLVDACLACAPRGLVGAA